jgi:hypothetical protein
MEIMKDNDKYDIQDIRMFNEKKSFYIFYILYKCLYKYSIINENPLINISDQIFYKNCKFKNIYKIYYCSEKIEHNINSKKIILYINSIFDDFFLKNNTTNSYDNLIKLNTKEYDII